ncbi:LolA family protein [Desulfovibrio litoralis]|uniref:Outer membrane lipoprotein carrier protein n=1 Tax=Desulfovibrio litoralis DSM 11393 TaxID=1121455 RepID=A0A1M7T6R6_9BACT|nr:outer-membrane lipoprotein carrier protein LolA [Desulfovibrio litoralis]SHN66409.1 outer membrane lipoprotein carrier protein [Desulfovibrio litoralis DSM 11393]
MYNLYKVLSCCLAVFLFSFAIYPQNSFGAEQIAIDVQKKYDSMKSMKASFKQVLFHKESGNKEERTGIIEFKKPLLVRWETFMPSPELLLVTDKEIWNFFPDEEVAYKYSLDLVKDPKSIVRVITGLARLDQDFEIKDEGMENGLVKLRLYPHEPVQAFVEGVIWVDKSSSIIRRFRIMDFYANENDISFTDQEINPSIKDKEFQFSPPKDAHIEDRTDAKTTQKPLMQ